MKINPFLLILAVLIMGIGYVYMTADKKPDKGTTDTPKAYIEKVEREKVIRLQQERRRQAADAQSSR